jgi:hypothetical protein
VSFWFGILVPAAIVISIIVYDTLSLFGPFRLFFGFIAAPFNNFITLEDLRDPIGQLRYPAFWTARVLCVLPVLASLTWIATLGFSLSVRDKLSSARAGVSLLLWVRYNFLVL